MHAADAKTDVARGETGVTQLASVAALHVVVSKSFELTLKA